MLSKGEMQEQSKTVAAPCQESVREPYPADTKAPLNVDVMMRRMGGSEYLKLLDSLWTDDGEPVEGREDRLQELIVARSWVDENGERQLGDDELDSDWWASASPGFLLDMIAAANRVNGLGKQGLASAIKNSEDTDGSDSPDELPPDSDDPSSEN